MACGEHSESNFCCANTLLLENNGPTKRLTYALPIQVAQIGIGSGGRTWKDVGNDWARWRLIVASPRALSLDFAFAKACYR
jgi:hypothetical protein